MSRVATVAALATLCTIGFGIALPVGAPPALALRAWLLAVGAIAAGAVVAACADAPAEESELERALVRPAPRLERPQQLDRIEREVVLGCASAFDLHHRLRPTLREIAAQRLADRHGLDLDTAGPDVLTADTWALLRPDLEPPRDRHASGLPLARLAAVIDELEAM